MGVWVCEYVVGWSVSWYVDVGCGCGYVGWGRRKKNASTETSC